MNTVHAPSNEANSPPTLVAEGRPVQVVTTADGACLLEIIADEPIDSAAKMRIMSWLMGLQPATLFDDAAQA